MLWKHVSCAEPLFPCQQRVNSCSILLSSWMEFLCRYNNNKIWRRRKEHNSKKKTPVASNVVEIVADGGHWPRWRLNQSVLGSSPAGHQLTIFFFFTKKLSSTYASCWHISTVLGARSILRWSTVQNKDNLDLLRSSHTTFYCSRWQLWVLLCNAWTKR